MTEREVLVELLIESHRVFSDDAEELADMILAAGFHRSAGEGI